MSDVSVRGSPTPSLGSLRLRKFKCDSVEIRGNYEPDLDFLDDGDNYIDGDSLLRPPSLDKLSEEGWDTAEQPIKNLTPDEPSADEEGLLRTAGIVFTRT